MKTRDTLFWIYGYISTESQRQPVNLYVNNRVFPFVIPMVYNLDAPNITNAFFAKHTRVS